MMALGKSDSKNLVTMLSETRTMEKEKSQLKKHSNNKCSDISCVDVNGRGGMDGCSSGMDEAQAQARFV